MNPIHRKVADGVRRVLEPQPVAARTAVPEVTASEATRPELQGQFSLVLLQGWIVAVLRQIYASAAASTFPGVTWVWSPGDTTGPDKLWIGSSGEFAPKTAGFLPALLVKLNDGETTGLTGGRREDSLGTDASTQTEGFVTAYRGTIQIVVLCDDETPCLALTSNTLEMMRSAAPAVKRDFCFTDFGTIGWAAPRPDPADGAPRRYKGEVRLSYVYRDTWSLSSERPRIKVFDFNASIR